MFIETDGKPYVAICDDCAIGTTTDASMGMESVEASPFLPEGWERVEGQRLRCRLCVASVREALERRRAVRGG